MRTNIPPLLWSTLCFSVLRASISCLIWKMSRMAVTRSDFHYTVLRPGLDTLEMRVTEREQGQEAFLQGWSDRPFDDAAPSVERILHAVSKQKELLQVQELLTGLWSCNLFGMETWFRFYLPYNTLQVSLWAEVIAFQRARESMPLLMALYPILIRKNLIYNLGISMPLKSKPDI